MNSQRDRIEWNLSDESAPPVALLLRFTSRKPGDVLSRTRQVMLIVAVMQEAEWPTDERWKQELPEWFVRSFSGHGKAELIADHNLWDFGSWLDAMKRPGWEWWSSAASNSEGIVQCVADSDPYVIEPLIYLLRAAGASEIRFEGT